MKASELEKRYVDIDEIYKRIEFANARSQFKIFFRHSTCVSQDTKQQLIENGFKVYPGDWDGIEKNCLIIEW